MNNYTFQIAHEWNFGDDKALANKLKELVLSGKKTATTGLWHKEKSNRVVGSYEAILDNHHVPYEIYPVLASLSFEFFNDFQIRCFHAL